MRTATTSVPTWFRQDLNEQIEVGTSLGSIADEIAAQRSQLPALTEAAWTAAGIGSVDDFGESSPSSELYGFMIGSVDDFGESSPSSEVYDFIDDLRAKIIDVLAPEFQIDSEYLARMEVAGLQRIFEAIAQRAPRASLNAPLPDRKTVMNMLRSNGSFTIEVLLPSTRGGNIPLDLTVSFDVDCGIVVSGFAVDASGEPDEEEREQALMDWVWLSYLGEHGGAAVWGHLNHLEQLRSVKVEFVGVNAKRTASGFILEGPDRALERVAARLDPDYKTSLGQGRLVADVELDDHLFLEPDSEFISTAFEAGAYLPVSSTARIYASVPSPEA